MVMVVLVVVVMVVVAVVNVVVPVCFLLVAAGILSVVCKAVRTETIIDLPMVFGLYGQSRCLV